MVKKTFFQEPSAAQIKKKNAVVAGDFPVLDIEGIRENQYLVITSPLLPTCFQDEPRKFLKHGPEIQIHRYQSIRRAEYTAQIPLDLRRQAYERVRENSVDYSCYSFVPLIGNDRRRRRVSLVQILDGAQIFAYSHQVKGTEIKITPYDDARRVEREGAEVVLEIPSAEQKTPRHQIKFTGVPVKDTPRKFAIAHSLGSDHTCPFKTYREMRYTWDIDKENSRIMNLCKHEVAGWFGLVDHYWNQEHNLRPLEMSNIAMPSQFTVELYKRMLDSLLIYDSTIATKDNLRKPNQAEKQVLLDRAVKLYGHDKTLFANSERDGLLAQYNWKLRD
ncbi:MAG: hypothetical protein ABH840_00045 [Nanoarchaeota archaeon]